MASDNYSALGGAIAAVVNADWARATRPRSAVDWIPRRDVPVLRADRTFTDQWYRFFSELARRVGGVQGASITDVAQNVAQVQAEVLQVSSVAITASQSASAAENSISVIREVAINANLPGAGNIP